MKVEMIEIRYKIRIFCHFCLRVLTLNTTFSHPVISIGTYTHMHIDYFPFRKQILTFQSIIDNLQILLFALHRIKALFSLCFPGCLNV